MNRQKPKSKSIKSRSGDFQNLSGDSFCPTSFSVVGEIWKDIDNYGDKYLISSHGRVWNKFKNCLIKQSLDNYGYYGFMINMRKQKTIHVKTHREIAKVFIPNPQNKPQVNHKDGNKINNHVSNLEWVTHAENLTHAVKNGLISLDMAIKRVAIIDSNNNIIKVYNSMSEAAREVGCDVSGISHCCAGRIPHYYGYFWKKLDL